jgi:hypothetical protein
MIMVRPARSRQIVLACLVALLGMGPLASLARQATPPAATPVAAIQTVATGLANPRGVSFAADGTLRVAIVGAAGRNAGVVAIDRGCPRALLGGFPNSRVAFGLSGVADVAFQDDMLYALMAGGNIDGGAEHNGLYRVGPAGTATLIADVSAFIRDHPVAERPPDYDTDGQPFALLPVENGFWATEGNSGQLLQLGLDGSVSRVADLSAGHPIPTGIVPAPDGGAYVALFGHGPYGEGASRVVQIDASGAVSDVWTGLTLVTSLAIGPDRSLYALEMATGIDVNDPASIKPGTGKVVRRTPDGGTEDVVTGLTYPVAVELGPDDSLYIAGPAFSADRDEGTVLRIDLSARRPIDAASAAPPAACSGA